jgi:hypothetical protein
MLVVVVRLTAQPAFAGLDRVCAIRRKSSGGGPTVRKHK